MFAGPRYNNIIIPMTVTAQAVIMFFIRGHEVRKTRAPVQFTESAKLTSERGMQIKKKI